MERTGLWSLQKAQVRVFSVALVTFTRGRQAPGRGSVPIREEIVDGPCRNEVNLVRNWTDIRNTLRVPLTTIIPTGPSILLRHKANPDLLLN